MKRSFVHGQEIAIRQESDTVRQESIGVKIKCG